MGEFEQLCKIAKTAWPSFHVVDRIAGGEHILGFYVTVKGVPYQLTRMCKKGQRDIARRWLIDGLRSFLREHGQLTTLNRKGKR